MLYYLHLLMDWFSPLRIFQYITFRAFMAAGTAFMVTLLFGPMTIRVLRRLKMGQPVRSKEEALPLYEFHGQKAGTPTMGGVLIVASAALATILWANPTNGFVLVALATFMYMGLVGFWDDLLKVTRKQSKGLGAREKLLLQCAWALALGIFLLNWGPTSTLARQLMVPFLKDPFIQNLGMAGALVLVLVTLVGCTNAVNLTDGLDGLAIGCTNSVVAAYLAMSYVAGHAIFAAELLVPAVPGSGELAIFCGALLGAGLGFLWFNCYPAKVFMGDTGSLALGGAIAAVAILINQELTLMIVGGVFVMEAVSVLIQVACFKSTGRRVFRCAPIHHHFELLAKHRAEKAGHVLGLVETTITIRFWILSIIFALVGVATLKIR
jgi:phospho-N-acetylmuramoyl-pentapeptide-transferase